MVALDLLDLGPASTVPALGATSTSKAVSSAAPANYKRGDVVLAKYGKKDGFYWAKVKKVYKDNSHCDVEWLRPQAGTPAGKLYVLHDGYDETCCGDGLPLPNTVRRPSAAELRSGAPPGAGGACAVALKQCDTDICDLLGEPSIEIKATSECISPNAPALGIHQQGHVNSIMPGPMSTPSYAGPAWQANFDFGPPNAAVRNAAQSPASAVPSVFGVFQTPQNRSPMQPFPSSAAPVNQPSSYNGFQTSFVSGAQQQKVILNRNSGKAKNEECFDFISDMMSGALTDVKK